MEFRFHELDKDVLVITADGGLNRQTADEFVTQVRQLIEGGVARLIVDCSGLDYISSYGLGVLLRLHATMKRHGGSVKVAGVHTLAAQALALTHLDRVFDLYPDIDRARLAFRADSPA